MKHSVILKFIAIVLCAAALLGALGSGFAILALTEGDLYNRTVEEMIDERRSSSADEYAVSRIAQPYASIHMGGCPAALVNRYRGYTWFEEMYGGCFGYRLLDEEGSVLKDTLTSELEEQGVVYRVRARGEYQHLLSSVPVQQPAEFTTEVMENCVTVYGISVSFDNKSSTDLAGTLPLGMLVFLEDGSAEFLSDSTGGHGFSRFGEVTKVSFTDDQGNVLFERSSAGGVGYLDMDADGRLRCIVYAEGQVPETTEAPFVVVGMPVYTAIFTSAGGESHTVSNVDGASIGSAYVDENGYLVFVLNSGSGELVKTYGSVLSLVLLDANGDVLFGYSSPQERSIPGITVGTQDGVTYYADPSRFVPAATDSTEPETTGATESTEPTVVATIPETQPVTAAPAIALEGEVYSAVYYDEEAERTMRAEYILLPMPDYTVEMYILPNATPYEQVYGLLGILRDYRDALPAALAVSVLLFAVCAVYLCIAAGRRGKTAEVRAGGLNRMPLDLYLLLGGTAVSAVVFFLVEGTEYLLRQSLRLACMLVPAAGYLGCLVVVGFCFAAAAQFKIPGGYWLRNTLSVRILSGSIGLLAKLERWLVRKGIPALWRLVQVLWRAALALLKGSWELACRLWVLVKDLAQRLFAWLGRVLKRFFALLPLTWQWMLGGIVCLFLGSLVFANRNDGWGSLWLLVGLALILYVSHCFGILLESTKRMSRGDLDTKVDDKLMLGCFQEFAGDLNALADVAVVAAQKQLKSERMKTELITNVSHDIKTPLTSIINYVDLLQKPHTPEEEKTYLEVLDRQSQRLKKLIEDLMEMSKASTGNMTVEVMRLDAVESVNQALGEFSDKLERAQLTPVFRHEEEAAWVMADGRLIWRVLSNLLGNAVKYAMPGTRLYLDLMTVEGKVVLSLKNISRDELNVDAEELMERFVRGDDSRNTEGSGLGLNIAKSLMELQKGQLQLLVDGDLFKVTLIFPAA